MMNLKLFFSGVTDVYRTFSTKTGSLISNSVQIGDKKRINKNKKKIIIEPKLKWTEEQKDVIDCVRCGWSVFITGSAGTGKTVLLNHIINILKKNYGSSGVAVTASTGVAACAIRGQTLHSFAGFGIANDDRETLLMKVLANSRAWKRWIKAEALIVDEISMIDANMFDNLEYIARKVRGSNKVWGGIQLIVSGDFFQLPPIQNHFNPSGKVFAFEADSWDDSFDKQVEITKVFRQADAELITLLQGIRKGMIDDEDMMKLLEQCCSSNEPDSSAVSLYPRIEDVNRMNEERMKSLGENAVVYKAVDGGAGINEWKHVIKQGMAPDQLKLCVGARVILIKNLNIWRKLCNGATGLVIGFIKPDDDDDDVTNLSPDNLLPIVKFDSGVEMVIEPQKWEFLEGDEVVVAWRSQLPLRLAYALSIHKCQGMTIDRLHTDLSRSFGYGMVYVVLSRVRTLKGLHLSGFSPSLIMANPKVLHFYEQLAGGEL